MSQVDGGWESNDDDNDGWGEDEEDEYMNFSKQ